MCDGLKNWLGARSQCCRPARSVRTRYLCTTRLKVRGANRHAENSVLAELRFLAHSNAEKTAGVWVDGHYVGYVKELTGERKMLLLPGGTSAVKLRTGATPDKELMVVPEA